MDGQKLLEKALEEIEFNKKLEKQEKTIEIEINLRYNFLLEEKQKEIDKKIERLNKTIANLNEQKRKTCLSLKKQEAREIDLSVAKFLVKKNDFENSFNKLFLSNVELLEELEKKFNTTYAVKAYSDNNELNATFVKLILSFEPKTKTAPTFKVGEFYVNKKFVKDELKKLINFNWFEALLYCKKEINVDGEFEKIYKGVKIPKEIENILLNKLNNIDIELNQKSQTNEKNPLKK